MSYTKNKYKTKQKNNVEKELFFFMRNSIIGCEENESKDRSLPFE